MHVLVTGANGFVGSALCRNLVQRGDVVRGLVRKTSDLALLEGIPVQLVTGALGEPSSLEHATQGIDLVYHVAAATTDWGTLDHFRQVNVQGTRSILEAAVERHVKRFVYVSSVAVHGFGGAQDMDEQSPQPPTPFPYCRSKQEAEALVRRFHEQGRIAATIVRPGDVYGPGDRVVLLKMASLLETGRMVLIGRGETLGAFTYVENLADGLILAGTTDKAAGRAYIVTDGIRLTWREYLERLTAALEVPGPRACIHSSTAYAAARVLESIYRLLGVRRRPPVTRYVVAHLSRDFHFCIDRARRELGYEPRIGIDKAIANTAEWYRQVVRG